MNAASILRHSAKHRDLAKRQRAFKAYKLSEAKYRVLGLRDNHARSRTNIEQLLSGAQFSPSELVLLNERQAKRLMRGEVV